MTTTRRTFLKVVGTGATALSVGAAGCGAPAGPIEVGAAADFAEGLTKIEGTTVLVGRDAGGLYAMTSLCTHLGCNLNDAGGQIAADGEITCSAPCGHQSKFDADGAVVNGPAGTDLKHWECELAEDGQLSVNVGTEVAADVRVALP